MTLKLDELLNPPTAGSERVQMDEKEAQQDPHAQTPSNMTLDPPFQREFSTKQPSCTAVTQAFEAANALTALATLGSLSGSMQSPPQSQHSPTATPNVGSVRHNSIGAPVGVPIEPTPDTLQEPLTRSPTLEQYHHGSRSPEEKRRRESLAARNSPPLVLAPLQNLTGTSGRQAENALGLFQGPVTAAPANRLVSAHNGDHTDFIKSEKADQPSQSHSPAQIKQEPDSKPNLTAGSESPAPKNVDADTKAAIQAIQNEHGLRGGKKKPTPQPTADEEPAPVTTPKKRPPPKSASKKGVAKKPPTKKRKVDNDSATSLTRQSATPPKSTKASVKASSKKAGSKSATPALGSSPRASSVQDDDDDDGGSEEDNEVYCICRRKDDHSWMIACDGGCDDWFHGKCVQMKEEDGPLIDKYICPNCQKKSDTVTTWKPMCRMDGCRNPARVAKSNASKYCSDECGVKFMRMMTSRTKEAHKAGAKKNKAKRKHRDDGMSSEEEEDLGPRGGMLRLGEVKSLATGATDIDSFRRLGDGVLSPPPSATENSDPNAKQNGDAEALQHTNLLPNEKSRLTAIVEEKDAMRTRMALLKDREKFVAMAKEQVLRYADREKLKPKDICGFDSRLSWSEVEFGRWRQSPVGVAALETGMLELPDETATESKEPNGEVQMNGDGDVDMKLNGDTTTENGGPTNNTSTAPVSDPFCAKKRCEKHKQWQKITLQDVRFDESELADRMRALEREERDVKERGMLRWRKERALGKGQNGVEVVAV